MNFEKVGIFCASGPVRDLDPSYVERGIVNLEELGYTTVFSEGVFNEPNSLQLAGSASQRAQWLHNLLGDRTIGMAMSFWGGLNTASTLPYIDFEYIIDTNKPIIGYSDTTSLLLSAYSKGFNQAYYGPAFISFGKGEYSTYTGLSLKEALQDNIAHYSHPDTQIECDEPYILQEGHANGPAIAGNLDTILSLTGTEFEPDYEGSILFIEEDESVDSRLFYRHMTHLEQSGIANKIAALCIGKFAVQSSIDQQTLNEIINITVGGDKPVISNLAFGHTDPLFTIPIGADTTIELSHDDFVLKFTSK